MSGPVHVILNPGCNGGRGWKIGPTVEEALRRRGIEYELHRTEGPGHGVELGADATREGAGRVLAVGGDGTIHEVVNGLLASPNLKPPALAVLPVGTGNDFHRMVGGGDTVEGAMALLDEGHPAAFDVGWASWNGGSRYFVNLLGVGLDVAVLERRGRFARLPGQAQYLAAVVAGLAGFRPVAVRAELEGVGTLEREALIAAVTIGPSVAGGIPLTAGASPYDGLLDFCLVERLGPARILYYLPRVLKGTHRSLRAVHLHRVESVRLALADGGPFTFELDGELAGPVVHRLDVRRAEVRLPVLVPASPGRDREAGDPRTAKRREEGR